jgi:hypothetical protein
MHGSHRTDEFHDDNGFTSASAAEDTGLATFGEGGDEVDDLHTRFEDFHAGGLFFKGGSSAMNGIVRGSFDIPFLSIGFPSTLKMRPNVERPTGTMMGAPVPFAGNAALQTIG